MSCVFPVVAVVAALVGATDDDGDGESDDCLPGTESLLSVPSDWSSSLVSRSSQVLSPRVTPASLPRSSSLSSSSSSMSCSSSSSSSSSMCRAAMRPRIWSALSDCERINMTFSCVSTCSSSAAIVTRDTCTDSLSSETSLPNPMADASSPTNK